MKSHHFSPGYQSKCNFAQMEICNRSIIKNISRICTEQPHTEEYPCYPKYLKEVGVYFGIWCIFICFLGMFGNLLTMLAIPYAANRRKYVYHNCIVIKVIDRKPYSILLRHLKNKTSYFSPSFITVS